MKKLSTSFYLAGLVIMETEMDQSVKNPVKMAGDLYSKARRRSENIGIPYGGKKSFCQLL